MILSVFDNDKELIEELKSLHSKDCKFVLRTTKGPIDNCISFHVDGTYATKTIQIPLNDPYMGGKLCFFINDKVEVPPRVPGSMTCHNRDILHGVTSVQQGIRNSFFVINLNNSEGLLDQDNVVVVKKERVEAYNARKETMELTSSLFLKRISSLNETINQLQQENDTLQDDYDDLQNDYDAMESTNFNNEQLVQNMQKQVDQLRGDQKALDSMSLTN